MIADKITFEVIVDKNIHDRIKQKTGISAMNGIEFVRAVGMLLNMHDTQFENIKAYQGMQKRIKEETQYFAKMEKADNVNSPAHYTQGGIECIDAIRASMTAEEFAGFLKGNVIKYLWRYHDKGKAVEDLKKGEWYLNRLTEHTEREKE